MKRNAERYMQAVGRILIELEEKRNELCSTWWMQDENTSKFIELIRRNAEKANKSIEEIKKEERA